MDSISSNNPVFDPSNPTGPYLPQLRKNKPTGLSQGISWSSLNDFQKASVLLNSYRLLDTDVFLNEFQSFEQPEADL
jgi:hypothetical protein